MQYRWWAFYLIDGILDSDSFAWACRSNFFVGNLTPLDESLTWECKYLLLRSLT